MGKENATKVTFTLKVENNLKTPWVKKDKQPNNSTQKTQQIKPETEQHQPLHTWDGLVCDGMESRSCYTRCTCRVFMQVNDQLNFNKGTGL